MKKILITSILLVFINVSFCSAEEEIPRPSRRMAPSLRVISLAPAATEILFALGLDEEIVGVTTFCNYPENALTKEKIGTFSSPDVEKILLLKPDMIFATGLEQAFTVERLRQLKLNIYVSDPTNIEELFGSIRNIALLVDREEEADILINRMKKEINEIKKKTKDKDRKKVFVEIWHDPLISAGKGSFVDELIDIAGGINITYDAPMPYSYFSSEQVIKRNPDCIILGHEDMDRTAVKKRLGWQEISAVQTGCIYTDINPDLFLRPGPRLVEGVKEIHKRLYPQ